jgi:dethiobiotin synthetase
MERYFITSSGTGVGKTFVTCKLIESLQKQGSKVNALKPIISGWDKTDPQMDSLKIMASLNSECSLDKISPWRFKEPLSPDMAARAEGRSVNVSELVTFCNEADVGDVQLIEGVGGVMVPLNAAETVLDWLTELDVSVILVVGSYLGSISHTLTALAALQTRAIRVASVVVSESEDSIFLKELETTLRNFIDVPIITLMRNENVCLSSADVKQILGD